jgi:hypothetical protein
MAAPARDLTSAFASALSPPMTGQAGCSCRNLSSAFAAVESIEDELPILPPLIARLGMRFANEPPRGVARPSTVGPNPVAPKQ